MLRWESKIRFTNKDDASANQNQQAQMDFYNTLTKNYNTDFGQFEGASQELLGKLKPIVDAGPGQYGFDKTEDAAIRGAAIESDAAAAKNAEVAANQQITASNGGAALTPTGAQEQLKQEADVAAAQKTATDQNTITQAGYKAGQENYAGALSAEGSVIGMMNPNAFAGSATGGGNAATGAVNADVNAQQASMGWESMVGGALGGVTGALTAHAIK